MSWDLLVFGGATPPPPGRSDEAAPFAPTPLGSLRDVRDRISAAVPGTDWADPHWGKFVDAGLWLEFDLGTDDPCPGLAIHVHGSGDAAAPILRLADIPGWYVFDTAQGKWLHNGADPGAGWASFRRVRDNLFPPADV